LDDHALRVIAAGMWGLKTFTLTGCSGITDSGIAEVARCCHHLETLDVSSCERVGEYGDKALLEVGKYCHELTTLNMFGCKHVADAGIKAIANGCRSLQNLSLTGCRELSGSAVKR
jgi:F-box/leucine-rich repeat protein 2/20